MILQELIYHFGTDAQPILPRLWLGNAVAGEKARVLPEFDVLNVSEQLPEMPTTILVAEGDGYLLSKKLDEAAVWIQCRDRYRKILVHCLGGRDRSPAVVIRYFELWKGMSYEDAWAWVKHHRTECNDRRDWIDA